MERKAEVKSPLFHIRPLFIAALGLCFGTGLFVLYSDAAHNALLLFLLGCSLLFLKTYSAVRTYHMQAPD